MAAHMISLARKEYAAEWRPRGTLGGSAQPPSDAGNGSQTKPPAPEGDPVEPKRVRSEACHCMMEVGGSCAGYRLANLDID